ncbi:MULTISPECIES: uracil-DNA glycosylase family protein [Lactobacillaceae]|uniref:Uracil-DNA glycosylase family protein n=1 Tax=Limosilactobacillus alvi TaxID=990412 RepID=A0ABS2EPN7_9LACO|nr:MULTISPECIES: uracil-DNA glycosylase family protein [Lactobacillaceae]MBM6754383.1 uracil-DNA glycosylase family protein [Limosilactobacillus alvi]QLL69293.1 uracil-DNA glycosylase family protein [Lactobacillus sp. 3B(2020)]
MTQTLAEIINAIKADPENAKYTAQGIDPLFNCDPEATILIIGQAPGRIAQEKRIFWDDPSGDRLRDWMGIDRDQFYHSGKIAVVPMDFYFPGKGKSGDLPPRKDFAAKWHQPILKLMPKIQLTLLVGSYATKRYLHLKSSAKLTDIVKNYQAYQPEIFPLVHPSPRNQIWMKKNPWFVEQVLPDLKVAVQKAMLA